MEELKLQNVKGKPSGKKNFEIIELYGNLQQEESDELEEKILSLIDQGITRIVLDLTHVNNMCSSSLGMLASYQKSLKNKRGSGIRLVVISNNLLELLKVTMLNRAFDIYDVKEDAIRSLQ